MTEDSFHVAVIGAGMAGIIAARDLSNQGYSVVLLEARDRVGGRTYMDKAFGGEVELGGAYVHWTQPNMWYELQRHGIPLLPPLEASKAYWLADGKVHSGTEKAYLDAVGPAMAQLTANARAHFPMPFNIMAVDNCDMEKETLEDGIRSLNLSAYERDVLDGALAGIVHSYSEQGVAQILLCVAAYFGDYKAFFETASFWAIEGGTKRLIEAIMAESSAKLCLSTPVRSISQDTSHVTITTRAGQEIHAHSAIVAVPLNTLGDITLTPDLPSAARRMVDQKNPVLASKLWALAKGRISPFSAFAPVDKHPINAARTESYTPSGHTLVMCICSNAAAINPSDKHAVQTALRKFVPDIEVLETTSHDWVNDEFSKGGWMMHRPGNLTGAAPLMREPLGRVYFAGSDIAAMDTGAIEGAMESGAVAAREVGRGLGCSRL